jgi:hypothetical protein
VANHEKVTEAGARKVYSAHETSVLNLVQTWMPEGAEFPAGVDVELP